MLEADGCEVLPEYVALIITGNMLTGSSTAKKALAPFLLDTTTGRVNNCE
jgi:hypothetical protein